MVLRALSELIHSFHDANMTIVLQKHGCYLTNHLNPINVLIVKIVYRLLNLIYKTVKFVCNNIFCVLKAMVATYAAKERIYQCVLLFVVTTFKEPVWSLAYMVQGVS